MFIFPKPKKMICQGEFTATKKSFRIVRDDFESPELEHAMSKFEWSDDGIALSIILNPDLKKEEYYLALENDGATITASTTRGVFYAVMTLCQAIRQKDLQCFMIEDYPDFEDRGLMFDYSRGKIPTLEDIKKTVDKLAEMKYNQLQMAFDAIVFEYKGLEKYYEGSVVVTREYAKELQDYCKKNMIDLVPNQNSFGHMHDWLALDDFKDLAECPEGFYRTDEYDYTCLWAAPGTLKPYDPRSLELVDRIYGGLLPYFDSKLMHCCCDETFDLSDGEGFSHKIVKEKGLKKVYTEYMNKLHGLTEKYGKRMMFWADMIMDSVDALKDMPKDSIAVVWGYEHEFPYDVFCKNAKESGLDFYVAPGTCTWSSIVGRSNNMMYTQQSAAENGKKYGAKGYLLTQWAAHTSSPVTNEVPIAYGAAMSWGVEENREIEGAFRYLDENLFFEDGFAEFLFDCGNAYTFEANKRFCVPALSTALGMRLDANYYMQDNTSQHFLSMIRYVEGQLRKLDSFEKCSSEYIEEIRINLEMVRSLAKVCVIKTGGDVDIAELIAEFEDQAKRLENMWFKSKCLIGSTLYADSTKKLIEALKIRV